MYICTYIPSSQVFILGVGVHFQKLQNINIVNVHRRKNVWGGLNPIQPPQSEYIPDSRWDACDSDVSDNLTQIGASPNIMAASYYIIQLLLIVYSYSFPAVCIYKYNIIMYTVQSTINNNIIISKL